MKPSITAVVLNVLFLSLVNADVRVPNIFGDHMVLQQGQKNPVWGKAEPGETVSVTIAGQIHEAVAGGDGNWEVKLEPLSVGGPYEMVIKGKNELRVKDVLIGEVWVCSGQSNMEWKVRAANDSDLEKVAAKYPQIRMINFPQVGSQEPVWTHDRPWMVCSPETIESFSAVGYFFGRQLHQTLNVPVGLINNAWGGSACEAWINRDVLKGDQRFAQLMQRWEKTEADLLALQKKSDLTDAERKSLAPLKQNQRPANIYNGVLKSHLGYGIKGAIWYQGESNAGRAYQYRDLFPTMISNWRNEWKQGDFPFYWVQLADFKAETKEPGESEWAELREAQTMAMSRLPNTGQAVIIDLGEGKDIHPRNKVDVARRLARWALAKQYGVDIPYRSPQYKSMEKQGNTIVLTFDHVSSWRPFDVTEPIGFAIAGADRKFVWAKAKLVSGNRIEVTSPEVPDPVAVRYAWADNPVCNLFDISGLPLTPFRTDDWPGITAEKF